MTGAVNTNVEALKAIRDSMCRFQERIQPLQGELVQSFELIDEELLRNYKQFERQLEERRRRGTQDGQTDTFACDRCGSRIRLKIRGDTTNCREQGCHGTLHRVYRDNSYSGEQRRKDIEEMEEIRSLIKDYAEQKAQMITVFSEFFTSDAGDIDARKMTLGRCIELLEDYLSTDLFLGTDSYSKKKH